MNLSKAYLNLLNLPFQGVHSMMPVSWPVSVVMALVLSLVHLGFKVASDYQDFPPLFVQRVSWKVPLFTQHLQHSQSLLQLIGEVILLATASVSGLYYRIMSDAAHNRTVDGTRTGIEQRVKLECEREQQEQLLLSVIPAYIAAEVLN